MWVCGWECFLISSVFLLLPHFHISPQLCLLRSLHLSSLESYLIYELHMKDSKLSVNVCVCMSLHIFASVFVHVCSAMCLRLPLRVIMSSPILILHEPRWWVNPPDRQERQAGGRVLRPFLKHICSSAMFRFVWTGMHLWLGNNWGQALLTE